MCEVCMHEEGREPTEADEARWSRWRDLRARKEAATTDLQRALLDLEEEQLQRESITEVLKQDMSVEPVWMWLSFADETGSLGVAIVEGGGVVEAALNAKLKGCNPGGEVMAYPLPPEHLPAEELRNRLLSAEDLRAAGLIAEWPRS